MKTRKVGLTLFAGIIMATLFAFNIRDKSLVGLWDYTVKNAPQGYEKGIIRFSEKEGMLAGDMVTNDETFPMTNLKVNNDTVTYDLTIESTPVNVVFVNLKDSIAGKITTPDNVYDFKGYKKKEN